MHIETEQIVEALAETKAAILAMRSSESRAVALCFINEAIHANRRAMPSTAMKLANRARINAGLKPYSY